MNLRQAYQEWCNCGNTGSLIEWALSVGISIEDIPKEDTKEDKENERM